jgi:hypothetical protein
MDGCDPSEEVKMVQWHNGMSNQTTFSSEHKGFQSTYSKYLQWGCERREFSFSKLRAFASFALWVGSVPSRNMASPVGQAIGSNRFNQGLFQDITSCSQHVFTRRGHPPSPSMLSKSQLTVLSGSSTWLPVTPRKTAEIVLEYRIEQCNQLQHGCLSHLGKQLK